MPSFIQSTILALAAASVPTTNGAQINKINKLRAPAAPAAPVAVRAAPELIEGPASSFPTMGEWSEFEELLESNKPSILASGSTEGDISSISDAVRAAEGQYGVDARVILAMIMQESHGYVGVETTYSPDGIATAGLMQCGGCTGYPNQTDIGADKVAEMVNGGVEHLMGNIDNQGGDAGSEEVIYPALREYNSGSVNLENLSDGLGATDEYVSDVAQRMTGWTD